MMRTADPDPVQTDPYSLFIYSSLEFHLEESTEYSFRRSSIVQWQKTNK